MVLIPRAFSPDWHEAKCSPEKGIIDVTKPGQDVFFGDEDAAVEFCRTGCEILEDCLIWAMINNNATGVYGGTSELDRKAIRKRWPLERSYKVDGKSHWDPRPEWQLFEPGLPTSWFDEGELRDDLRRELESED